MGTNYTRISNDSFVELQLHDQIDSPIEKSPQNPKKVQEFDDLDEFDELDKLAPGFGPNHDFGSGLYGAVFNLTTSVIGAGIMALPATMKVLGLLVGVVLIFLMGVLSEISVEFLIRFAVQCKANTYGEVVENALGKTARIVSEICIVINNAGVLVVYLIIIGDVMSGSLRHIGVFDQWLGNGFWDHRKIVILIVVVVFLAPLCLFDKIDSLSTTSAASVALAVVFVLVAFVVAFIKVVEGKIEAPRLTPDFSSETAILDLLVVIPIMSNAYVCHFNVQPIYNELKDRSPEKMNKVGRMTTLLCVMIYASTAIAGYLLFGDDTESDILTNFDKPLGIKFSTALTYIVRVGYILHLVLVFPVIHFSLRQTVDELAFEGRGPLYESRKRCVALTVVLLALVYIGSTMIPSIWTAFKFTGATTAVSLGFTFPALIALRLSSLGPGLTSRERFLAWLMLCLAVIVSIVGVVGNIFSMQNKSG
ncbi:transmembrane amino acid transporter family protein [Artemisia annua]|uniref:Transmembrane amino acid transporter family protein n=1 Tax=Artemisia annua TaxID=35608 RepID=A0A2U1P3A7_ARTAN|nr:transmembrane amino acid transporter family protein [Artemisia annua]